MRLILEGLSRGLRRIVRDSAPDDPAVSRGAQLAYMGGVIVVTAVVVSIFADNVDGSSIPPWVWLAEFSLVVVCIASSADWIKSWFSRYLDPRDERPQSGVWRWRDEYGHLVVMAVIASNTVVLWRAVEYTGGPYSSPFASFLSAPAFFGAFVAQTVRGVVQLFAVSTIFILSVYWTSEPSVGAPHYAYSIPTLVLLFSAGLISLAQLARDQVLRGRYRAFAAHNSLSPDELTDLGAGVWGLVVRAAAKSQADPQDGDGHAAKTQEGEHQL